MFEQIEKLKTDYTDKYVIVQEERPELRRFKGLTGVVRTVNMSGRALVEFDAYNNIGWIDIDLDYLSVIDKPLEKVEEPKKGGAAKGAKAKAGGDAKGAASAKAPAKMSVEDMLAAARGEGAKAKGGAATKGAESKDSGKAAAKSGGAMSVEDMLAAARAEKSKNADDKPAAPKTPAPTKAADPTKMSVEEMLAAARGEKAGGSSDDASSDDAGTNDAGTTAAEATPEEPPKASAATTEKAKVDPTKMSVEEMLAAARAEKSGGGSSEATAENTDDYPVKEDPADEVSKIKQDDLKIVEGVGPKIEGLLKEDGILTLELLSKADVGRIKEILEAAGSRYKMHDPTTWPDQAGLAAAGKLEELQKYQDDLTGGRA